MPSQVDDEKSADLHGLCRRSPVLAGVSTAWISGMLPLQSGAPAHSSLRLLALWARCSLGVFVSTEFIQLREQAAISVVVGAGRQGAAIQVERSRDLESAHGGGRNRSNRPREWALSFNAMH